MTIHNSLILIQQRIFSKLLHLRSAFGNPEIIALFTPQKMILTIPLILITPPWHQLIEIIRVVDTHAPHIAPVSNSFLNGGVSALPTDRDTEDATPRNTFDKAYLHKRGLTDDNSTGLYLSFADSPAIDTSPYIATKGENYNFYLKLSEANSSLHDATNGAGLRLGDENTITNNPKHVTILAGDSYNHTFAWHSAIKIDLGNNNYFQDPGIYVENLSNSAVTISSEIKPNYPTGEQLESITINYIAEQVEGALTNRIDAARIIYFIDEVKPQITLNPHTDGNNKFILVEAGDSYEDKTGYFWDKSVVNESSVKSAELGDPTGVQTTFLTKADDAVDGTIAELQLIVQLNT